MDTFLNHCRAPKASDVHLAFHTQLNAAALTEVMCEIVHKRAADAVYSKSEGLVDVVADDWAFDLLAIVPHEIENGRVNWHAAAPDGRPIANGLEDFLADACLRVLRMATHARILERRYGWRRDWLPLPVRDDIGFPEYRVARPDPTKPCFGFETAAHGCVICKQGE